MPKTTFAPNPFRPALFAFLRELAKNNDRDWFHANKPRFEEHVKDAALRFISDFGPHLREISPHLQAIPKAVGGSLFRIYRDTRFSKDKSPYKTHLGIQFRHERARDVHAPGFYLHIDPAESFVGCGVWHPDSKALAAIRARLQEDPAGWKRAVSGKRFREDWELAGESLKRAPRGVDPEHPLIEDLKRKDFIGVTRLTQKEILAPEFPRRFTERCRQGAPLVGYLCTAVGVDF